MGGKLNPPQEPGAFRRGPALFPKTGHEEPIEGPILAKARSFLNENRWF
jgi:hypothetical protein